MLLRITHFFLLGKVSLADQASVKGTRAKQSVLCFFSAMLTPLFPCLILQRAFNATSFLRHITKLGPGADGEEIGEATSGGQHGKW